MIKKELTKEVLIKDLQEWAKKYHKKFGTFNVTRNYYRKHSKYSETDIENFFPTFSEFKENALSLTDTFKRVDNDIVRSSETSKGKYLVSSVIEGSRYNKDFLQAMINFCKEEKAKLILLWVRGVRKEDSFTSEEYESLKPYLATEYTFNSKLSAIDFMLYPTQILPLTGLNRFGTKDSSLIVASPKQHMESVARPKGSTPHILWSTGTISIPRYSKTRAGSLAKQDNVLGGLVVEIEGPKRFFIRPVQWIGDGFVDLGKKYLKNSTSIVKARAMVWGDLHAPNEDKQALKLAIEQAKFVKAENIFLHDVCSFESINHHNKHKYLTRSMLQDTSKTLKGELNYTRELLKNITSQFPKNTNFYIVHSNHDNFIKKYLEDGDFIKDTPNAVMGAKMFIDLAQKKNPLEYIGNSRTTFLEEDGSFKIEGIELGLHGSETVNGGRSSIRSFGRTQDKAVIAHSHSPNIFFSVYQVGTLSNLELGYNKGLSSWLNANAIIYEGGYVQMIVYVDGKWRI